MQLIRDNVITQLEHSDDEYSKLFGKFNKAYLIGTLEEEFQFHHQYQNKNFYATRLKSLRLSQTEDLVPIIVSYSLLKQSLDTSLTGKCVEIIGDFRSHNYTENGCKHRRVYLLAKSINVVKIVTECNLIYLNGFVCQSPHFRRTPLGRKITEITLSVSRSYNYKTDYIPCITWGADAEWSSTLEIGDQIELCGRMQSRKYFKRIDPNSDDGEYRYAYEISVIDIQKI